jgi:hypothetical protein
MAFPNAGQFRNLSGNIKIPMSKTNDEVVVVREDGEQFTIPREHLAAHINRGFTVKSKADMPTEKELASEIGYTGEYSEKSDNVREPQRAETYEKEVVAKLSGDAKKEAAAQVGKDNDDELAPKKASAKKSK